eukprot:1440463-Amphidinium_carterae.2
MHCAALSRDGLKNSDSPSRASQDRAAALYKVGECRIDCNVEWRAKATLPCTTFGVMSSILSLFRILPSLQCPLCSDFLVVFVFFTSMNHVSNRLLLSWVGEDATRTCPSHWARARSSEETQVHT